MGQRRRGSTVWVAGKFTKARPAGAAAGSSEVGRGYGMAYNINDGKMTSFNPGFNGEALAVAVSPDGKRVYFGGNFTSSNGVLTNRIAAFDTATGKLITTFKASVNGLVRTLAVTNTTVYAGGSFTTSGGNARPNIAAFSATTGSTLTWNPIPNAPVYSMAVVGSKLAIGGMFTKVNGAGAYGLAFVSTGSGTLSTFAATSVVKVAGKFGAIDAITTDGSSIYVSAFAHGTSGANFEGTFAATTDTGAIKWMEDCHGDTYGNYARSGVVYVVSHAHDCARIGGFPQSTTVTNHATAFVNGRTGTVTKNTATDIAYTNFAGQPATSLLPWFPTLTTGTVSGQAQAAWAIAGNSSYIVIAGEFPSVGAKKQQGLARFALRSNTQNPKSYGPQVLPADWKPTLTKPAAGQVKVSIPSQWDRDNGTLEYKIYRGTTLVKTIQGSSFYWALPTLTFTDTGLAKGSYTYKVTASDVAYGGIKTVTSTSASTSVTTAAAAPAVQPNARIAAVQDATTPAPTTSAPEAPASSAAATGSSASSTGTSPQAVTTTSATSAATTTASAKATTVATATPAG